MIVTRPYSSVMSQPTSRRRNHQGGMHSGHRKEEKNEPSMADGNLHSHLPSCPVASSSSVQCSEPTRRLNLCLPKEAVCMAYTPPCICSEPTRRLHLCLPKEAPLVLATPDCRVKGVGSSLGACHHPDPIVDTKPSEGYVWWTQNHHGVQMRMPLPRISCMPVMHAPHPIACPMGRHAL